MSRLRGEWFWCDRWLMSSAALLPLEARGLYRECLTVAWTRGARLPIDETAIRLAVRATVEEWQRSWPLIAPYWRAENGWLINATQQEVYQTALAIEERKSERGRRGAAARWGR